ncbi:Pathogenesis-related protein STH-21 [Bienertia sinuspersici]
MGVHTFTILEEASPIAPARLFKAMCLDNHNLIPKVVPHLVKSIDFVEGDSTVVGCVKQFNLAEGSPYTYVKGKLNEIDVDNHYVKYTNFEGDLLGDLLECVVYENKFEASGSGSQCKVVAHYHTKGDTVVTEEQVNTGFQGMLLKAVGDYLSNNPDVYA